MGVVDEAKPVKKTTIRVREFDVERDPRAVEELERLCQVGLSGDQGSDHPVADHDRGAEKTTRSSKKKKKKGMSLYVEQIGDPFARVRHAPDNIILVAEYGEEDEVVGVIKACTRMVSRGKKKQSLGSSSKQFVKVACLLGLRVSPSHRRLGVATELVRRAEAWCAARGAAYATMATTESNAASLALFTGRFAYAPFRRPAFLGRPVHRHRRGGPEEPARAPSFAMLSVWDATRSLRLRVGGAPALLRASLAAARALDRHVPWLQVPSVPDIFRPFGTYLLYGLRMSGPEGPALLRSLCQHAHNVARKNPACAVLAADLGPGDPAKAVVPHWPKFSCDEDVWCIKKLGASAASDNAGNDDDDDWTTSPPPSVLFVDPREF
ncbi:putative N-acetyltransferase HLS1-like [Zea mays]|uniref:Putative N-acetyltransferase HLS1-like n=1 Tax=Zea mays TaxID=4577 RepID=A0A3L6EZC1_MAIZE|nr:putative N-acetyltransferase HLS1-like [Zea mays]